LMQNEISLHVGVVRKFPKFREGVVHLGTSAFKEFTATTDKQCIAGEYTTRNFFIGCICRIIANRILGVAWCGNTSTSRVFQNRFCLAEELCVLDMYMITDSEFIVIFDGIRQRRYLRISVSPCSTIHGDVGVI
jgi:hypothetical protein